MPPDDAGWDPLEREKDGNDRWRAPAAGRGAAAAAAARRRFSCCRKSAVCWSIAASLDLAAGGGLR